jgi:hypothetical protein
MLVRSQRFPISDGEIVSALETGLAASWGAAGTLTVRTKLPETKTRRMVTVRDDSGLAVGRTQPRRQGVNVWADTSVDALNLALDAMHICETVLPDGYIIAAADRFTGPYEIQDDVPYVVQVSGVSTSLIHYYFTFVATVKAAAA